MASIKVKFRPSVSHDLEGSVYYQITHQGRMRQITPGHKLFPSEWDARRATTTATLPANSRSGHLRSVRQGIQRDIDRLTRICRRLDDSGNAYTVDDIVEGFRAYMKRYSLFGFMRETISHLSALGRFRTAETYGAALSSFGRFRGGRDIMLDCITPQVVQDYEAWMRGRGLIPNTISFYNRILRAVYNRAADNGDFDNIHPFRKVYTGIDKTVKRALPIAQVRKIKSLDLSQSPRLDYARDMFMMSFYLRGMSFVDMAFLRKSDLANGYVTYRRRKTGQRLTIAWTKEMKAILDKYPENDSGYLLPVIRTHVANERNAYRSRAYAINRNLKQVGAMAGVTIPLTLYVARHSWASAARAKGIPLPVISEGMGHDSESTTRIYLANLDTTVVDRANAIILKSLG